MTSAFRPGGVQQGEASGLRILRTIEDPEGPRTTAARRDVAPDLASVLHSPRAVRRALQAPADPLPLDPGHADTVMHAAVRPAERCRPRRHPVCGQTGGKARHEVHRTFTVERVAQKSPSVLSDSAAKASTTDWRRSKAILAKRTASEPATKRIGGKRSAATSTRTLPSLAGSPGCRWL